MAGSGERESREPSVDLIERHFDDLYRHVALVYPLADANEITRQSFHRLGRTPGAEVSALGARAVLRRAARRLVHASGELDRRRNCASVIMALQDTAEQVGEGDALLVAALSELPVPQQELLRLTSVEDLSMEELAVVLDVGIDAARARLDDARTALALACRRPDDEVEAEESKNE